MFSRISNILIACIMLIVLVGVLQASVVFTEISAWAGTWSDGFEHQNLDEWQLHSQVGNQPVWKIENGMLLAVQSGSSGVWIGDDTWKDYSVEATVVLLEERRAAMWTEYSQLTRGRHRYVLEGSSSSRPFLCDMYTPVGWKGGRGFRWS